MFSKPGYRKALHALPPADSKLWTEEAYSHHRLKIRNPERNSVHYQNAFVGRKEQPSANEVDTILGEAATLWHSYIDWMAREHSVTGFEWKSSGPKHGWSLRLQLKKRNIVYLGPCSGCFLVAFALGDRAIAEAKAADFPAPVRKIITEATKYPEGTAVRLLIQSKEDLLPIQRLAEIKLAN